MATMNIQTAMRLAILAVLATACSVLSDFDRPLDMPDLRDANTEVIFSCENDDDCSALGPCIVCSGYICVEADDADDDEDGHFSMTCAGAKKGEDCDDNDPDVHPAATERCNGRDDNCDGVVDEGEAFGLSWTVGRADTRSPSAAPIHGRTGLAWLAGSPPCSTVLGAFVDLGGAIRYPTALSDCGEDVWLVDRGSSVGFSAAWVDRTEGGAEIYVMLLDPSGDPDPSRPDPVNISNDFEESDMPVLAWSPTGYHFAAAWLSHDTGVRERVQVMLNILEPTGAPLLADHALLSSAPFDLTDLPDSEFSQRLDIVAVDSTVFEGFGVSWVQPDGIWIATVDVNEDGTDIESIERLALTAGPDTSDGALPSLTWADDRFVVAYAKADPATAKPSPDVMLAQVLVEEGGSLKAEAISFEYEFPREATYPAVAWHPDLEELGLAWADGRDGYGFREVRFARLKLTTDGGTGTQFVLDEGDLVLTAPGAYAAGVTLGFEPGGGYIASWTERTDDVVSLMVGHLECRQ